MLKLQPAAVLTVWALLAAGPALAQGAGALVEPFAVAGHGAPSPACLPVREPNALDAAAASGLPAQLSQAVARQLNAQVLEHVEDAPAAALVVTGCIQRAEAGDAVKRLVGLNMGASTLAAHVQLYRGGRLVRQFDVVVTGANKTPPIGPVGLAVHGVRGLHETLGADATKLSKQIADEIEAR